MPGAGGLSLKSLPSESRTPADQNEGLESWPPPPPRDLAFLAAESAARRRRDIWEGRGGRGLRAAAATAADVVGAEAIRERALREKEKANWTFFIEEEKK